jgi:probable rRNA maturation factor
MAADEPSLVDLVLEDERWQAAGLEEVAERAARSVLLELGLRPEECEISLLAADDDRVAALNASFRGSAAPTNVLSWPAFENAGPGRLPEGEAPHFLGDVALAYETCSREAREAGLSLADHAAHLVVHGILHLLGFDHEEEEEAERMEAIEVKTLASMGVADPYTR